MVLIVQRSTDIVACHKLRHAVFVVEQNVSIEEEMDGRDDAALHFLALRDEGPVGTARVLINGSDAGIGRVCVLRSERGRGTGAALMRGILADLRRQPDIKTASLGAQTHAIGFYEALGFEAEGPVFDDAGIPHRMMHLTL